MKNLIYISIAFFGFSASALAQEDIEQLQQQPPPATERQVERDAKKAAELQKSKDVTEKKTGKRNTEINKTPNDTLRKKRASKKTEKQ